jgi:hypothetical protein
VHYLFRCMQSEGLDMSASSWILTADLFPRVTLHDQNSGHQREDVLISRHDLDSVIISFAHSFDSCVHFHEIT